MMELAQGILFMAIIIASSLKMKINHKTECVYKTKFFVFSKHFFIFIAHIIF